MNSVKNYFEMSTRLFRGASLCSCFIALLLVAFAAMPAHAQVTNGVFTGTVTDPQGAVVARAEVAITNVGTSATVTVKTNADGLYRVPEVAVGTYRLTVTALGFKKELKTGVYLNAGAIERVDFTLELGQQTETVMVEAGEVQVQTEDSLLSTTIGAGQISNLPLNGRNVFDLIQLAPGAVNVTGVSFENGHSTVVNGLRPNFTGFLINGGSDKGLSGGVSTTPNADIVQEFQELTLNMSAQYGNSAAAIVNVVTKSGTNSLHGSVYEFLRNDKLDANDFFFNRGGVPKQPLRFNQFGATATGPIWKDHLFFTASYQGERFVTSAPAKTVISEAPQWRQAVISALPNSTAALIYKSFPTANAGTPLQNVTDFVGTNFSRYVCPANFPTGFKQLATKFQTMFGVTAAEAAACPGLVANGGVGSISRTTPFLNENVLVFGSQTQGNLFAGNEWSGRIDWLRTNDRVFGEFYWQKATDSFGPANSNSGIHGFKNPQVIYSPNFQTTWIHTFSPSWINEARAGYQRNRNDILTAAPGVPAIAFDDGSAGFGSYNGYPQFFRENVYSYGDMMTFVRGKHNIKTGVDFRRNLENSEFNVARPSYYFFDQLFFAVDAPYSEVGGVDPGFVGNKAPQLASNQRNWRNLEMGAFVQDDWKVRRNLTINVGLRYDLFGRHKEAAGRVTTFIPGPGCLTPINGGCADWISGANIAAGSPGCDTPFQISHAVLAGVCGPGGFAIAKTLGGSDHNNFGPRAGFAWDPWAVSEGPTRARFITRCRTLVGTRRSTPST